MSPRTPGLDARLRAYLLEVGLREHPALRALREVTDRLQEGGMRSSAEQAQLLAFLVELTGAERLLEIGCFTGYATLAMALALPPGGRIVTLDVNADWAEIGRRYWRQAGVEDRIELRLGLALDSLDALLAEGARGSFDLVYIDADKKRYEDYLDRALGLVRPGGLIAADNVLWHGAVADPEDRSRQAQALRRFNRRVHDDPRLALCMLPVGDGITLLRLRPRTGPGQP